MELLTKREERIMDILWAMKKGFVNDIIDQLPDDPKPPYTTISSIVRILEDKGFVKHKAYGKIHEYTPAVSKLAYKKFALKSFITNYFDGSLENVVSFMVEEKELSEDELNDISKFIQDCKTRKK
jgi:BlaI family transcriptional regulator, penicillinase repressor